MITNREKQIAVSMLLAQAVKLDAPKAVIDALRGWATEIDIARANERLVDSVKVSEGVSMGMVNARGGKTNA